MNNHFQVVGIITRHELTEHHLEERVCEMFDPDVRTLYDEAFCWGKKKKKKEEENERRRDGERERLRVQDKKQGGNAF